MEIEELVKDKSDAIAFLEGKTIALQCFISMLILTLGTITKVDSLGTETIDAYKKAATEVEPHDPIKVAGMESVYKQIEADLSRYRERMLEARKEGENQP